MPKDIKDTYLDLAALERLLAEATPGPWLHKYVDHKGEFREETVVRSTSDGLTEIEALVVGTLYHDGLHVAISDDNARLIVAMRNALPALIAEIRRLRQIETAARGLLDLVEVDTGAKMRTLIRAATLRNLFDKEMP